MVFIELLQVASTFGALCFIFVYLEHLFSLRKYPKGPFPLPVIGNLHLLSNKPFVDFARLSTTYGDVFSISLGMQRVVVVHTIEKAREALVKKGTDFAGRPLTNIPLEIFSRGFTDIAFSDYSKEWSSLRKHAHQSMHFYGGGMQKFEERIIEETESLIRTLKKENQSPVSVHHYLGVSTTNMICHLVFGKRYQVDDHEFQEIMKFLDLFFTGLNPSEPIVCMPWLRFFPPSQNFKRILEGVRIRDRILHQEITRHRAQFDSLDISDILYALLAQSKEQEITDSQLEMIVMDMFVAAIETILSTLRWSFLYLLHHPECQSKIYQEVTSVIGGHNKRKIVIDDVQSLPYVQAFIQETLRCPSVIPLNLPHKAIVDSTIGDVSIPKDCQVFINLHQIHHDEKYWKEPHLFNPDRWLTPEGQLLQGKNLSFLPFSAGPRNCFGEKLARVEMFLMITRIVAEFKIEPDPTCPLPDLLDGICGLSYTPHNYKAVFKVRKNP